MDVQKLLHQLYFSLQTFLTSKVQSLWTLSLEQPKPKLEPNPSPNNALHKPSITTFETHTMGKSLTSYLAMKVHPMVLSRQWSSIIVLGSHNRSTSQGGVSIASNEKIDKPFNWQRPTVSVSGTTLYLHVFPGEDYVRHYAAIVATYLSLTKGSRWGDMVRYTLPSRAECMAPLLESNLIRMGQVDLVIVGYVHRLDSLVPDAAWEPYDSSDSLFSWKKTTNPQGQKVAFLGCRICFWGDIGGNLVRALQKLNGAKCVIYVGKLGSLRAEHVPNKCLATGNASLVRGEMVKWTNPLEPFLQHAPSVVKGVHVCMGTVLDETKEWLRQAKTAGGVDFVDPEIGQMAKAAVEGGGDYGYLHIVSDNLARKYERDLSNERLGDVVRDREDLFGEIRDVLGAFIQDWKPNGSPDWRFRGGNDWSAEILFG